MTRYSNDETVVVEVHCHAATAKALLLSTDGKEDNAVWTPKSQILNCNDAERGADAELEMKQWIAKKNGFL